MYIKKPKEKTKLVMKIEFGVELIAYIINRAIPIIDMPKTSTMVSKLLRFICSVEFG